MPSGAEDPGAIAEKAGSARPNPSDEYRRWNRVLAEFFLLSAEPEQDVFLSVTPSTLSTALDQVEGELLTADDSQSALKGAVASMYSKYVLDEGHSIGELAAIGDDGMPHSVAFLAVSVLAAYDQERDPRRDEPFGRLPYYRPLSEALGCELGSNGLPEGFDPDAFDSLWSSLSYWVLESAKAVLDLPRSDRGHVAYPHRHVLLRQVDIDKLPAMFEREGFEPFSRSVSSTRMGRALDRYASLTGNAKSALGDERCQAVIEQTLTILEAWDGSVETGAGVRKAAIQIHLWFQRDVPILSYLPSRPVGFPDRFVTGDGVVLEDEDGPYYSSIPIAAEDGRALLDGFEWRSGRFTLRRPAARVVALAPASELSGFLSSPGLHLGRASAILCTDELEGEARAYLEAVSGRQQHPISGGELPENWALFRDVTPETVVNPPAGLEALEVSASVSVDFVGGIRLERGRTWLAGSSPRVLVTPERADVTVDGVLCTLVDGEVVSSALQRSGRHVITAGRVTRRMSIAEADVSVACVPLLAEAHPDHTVIALPHGSWTLLGSHPSESRRLDCPTVSGIFSCEFSPVWAVRSRRQGGIRQPILCLVDNPPPPQETQPAPECRAWCDAVRWAQQHGAGFERLGPTLGSVSDPRGVWSRYVAVSKRLRRRCGRTR